jgi:O-succinylbenzoic acid--CoA ligase
MSIVPAQLPALIERARRGETTNLRAILLGGAAAPPGLVESAVATGLPVLPTYGLTETFGQIATARVPGGALVPLPRVTILGGTRTDPEKLRVSGPMLASRYLDGEWIAPELVTADLGFVENGIVHVVGRADDVIISGGENVHPAQVERVIAATPGVRDVVVFGVPDERWGQSVAAAIAIDVPFDRPAALARWHAALPPFARPRYLAMTNGELPRLPSGKLDRRAAAALATTAVEYSD